VGFWQRFGLMGGLIASVFERENIQEVEIEKLKQGDMLESAFSEFATNSAPLYRALIAERDAYMAARLREQAAQAGFGEGRRVLVVIGAGHLKGLCEQLRTQQGDPAVETASLSAAPPKAAWPKWLALGLVLAVFVAIGFAFHRNPSLGAAALRDWVLYTGGFSAIGAIIAGAHPLSVLAAFVAGPIKPFRPGIPSGGISAMVEAWVRRPRVADFETLRDDIGHWRGWWRNRVARTLLNFFLVCLGTIIGEYTAGIHIVKSLL
jgi:pheromone shutdown protein TraB